MVDTLLKPKNILEGDMTGFAVFGFAFLLHCSKSPNIIIKMPNVTPGVLPHQRNHLLPKKAHDCCKGLFGVHLDIYFVVVLSYI